MLFAVVDQYKGPNICIMQSLEKKGPKRTVNRQQLYDPKKSQVDAVMSDPSIKGPKFDPKLKTIDTKPHICHPYGTRSKTKAAPISLQLTDIQDE